MTGRGGTRAAAVGLAVVSIGPAFQCTEYGYGSELRSSGVLRALCWDWAGDRALLRSPGSVYQLVKRSKRPML